MNLIRGLTGQVELGDHADEKIWKTATSIFDFHVEDMKHKNVDMSDYKGKVVMISNVAAK